MLGAIFVFVLIISCSKDEKIDNSLTEDTKKEELLSYELKQTTVFLNEEQLDYIVKAVNDTLFFNKNTPKECLPTIGTLLLENSITQKLFYGFYGRVTKIEEMHGLKTIIAAPIPLPEVFVIFV